MKLRTLYESDMDAYHTFFLGMTIVSVDSATPLT